MVFIEDMNGWGNHVRAEILKQGLPLKVTANPSAAQYLIRGGFDAGSGGTLELVRTEDGIVIRAERHRPSRRFFLKGASKALVEKLKKAMRQRN